MASGKVNAQEFMMKRWSAHKDAVRIGSFELQDGVRGFLCVDSLISPPEFTLLGIKTDGTPYAFTGDLGPDALRKSTFEDIAYSIHEESVPRRKPLVISSAMRNLGLIGDRCALAETSVRRFAESLGNAKLAARLPLAKLVATETARMNAAGIDKLRSILNPEVLETLSAVDDFQWRHYKFYAEEGEKGEIRRQAAGVYPVMATVMASLPSVKRAIDNKEPLLPALQTFFGQNEEGRPLLSKGIMKRLQGVDWPANGIEVDKLIRALSDIPPDWFPKTREEWDAFCDITATVGTVMMDATGLNSEVLYKGCSGKWVEFRDRLAVSYTDQRPPEGTGEEAHDFFKKNIDWKAIANLPKEKVRGAAEEAVSRIYSLPENASDDEISARRKLLEGIDPGELVDWIVRTNAPDTRRVALMNACIDVEQMLVTFAHKVILPLASVTTGQSNNYVSGIHIEEARRAAAAVLTSEKSANAIFENCRHFHSQYTVIMGAGEDQENDEARQKADEARRAAETMGALGVPLNISDKGWPPMTPIVQAPNGVYIVPLTETHLLQDEGRRGVNDDGSMGLHHCVGGYSGACQNQGHHILSFRVIEGGQFRRLSTAEINAIPHGTTEFEICQHRSRQNGAVCDMSARAMEWYRDEIRSGRIQINHDGIRQHLANVGSFQDDILKLCGYDWRDTNRIYEAMKPWGKYVGKRYRKMGLEEFSETPEIDAVSQALYPTRSTGLDNITYLRSTGPGV